MKENGFTLVELIAVLVILALIVIVAFPNIIKAIQNTNSKMETANEELLIANAKSYWTDNTDKLKEGNNSCVTVKTLVLENYTQTNKGILVCQECEECESKKGVDACKEETFCKECKKSEYNWGVVATSKADGKWEYAVSKTGC